MKIRASWMCFHSAHFSPRCLNCRGNNGKGGEKKIYLQRHDASRGGFPSSTDIPVLQSLLPALDKAPQARSSCSSGWDVFKALSDPAFAAAPAPVPTLLPLAKPRDELGRCSTDTPGERKARV